MKRKDRTELRAKNKSPSKQWILRRIVFSRSPQSFRLSPHFFIVLAVCTLSACDNVLPTPTPTRALSAPTLAASPAFFPVMPEGEPTQLRNAGQSDPTAAALPSGAELPPLLVGTPIFGADFQSVQITAPDSVIDGDLYPNADNVRVPGVLLLAADRTGWLDFPLRLQAAGFTVLSVSLPATNAAADSLVFNALIQALIQVGTVDPARITVVGVDAAAGVALLGCAVEPLCDALAILQPESAVIEALYRYNPRPILIAAFAGTSPTADAIRAGATGDALFLTADALTGVTLNGQALIQPPLGEQVIAWLAGRWG